MSETKTARTIIDFHTHIFPDKIADRAIAQLSSCINLKPAINGRDTGLIESMEHAGIQTSVILPIVTAPGQFDSITRFASYINEKYAQVSGPRLISVAGIHPESSEWKDQLALIAREGFAGIKIHPHYQDTKLSDPKYKRIIYRATELGLFTLTHTGYDPYVPEKDFCTPDMVLELVNDVHPENLVLAHMGNNMFYDEPEEKLCGLNVYFDTAYSISTMDREQFIRMVRKHGADKILFASDCPWNDQLSDVKILEGCPFTEEEKELIFHKNAERLLFH